MRKRFPEMYRKISAEAGHVVGHITTGSFSSAAPVERVNQKVTQTAQLDDPDCSAALKRIQCLLAETQVSIPAIAGRHETSRPCPKSTPLKVKLQL